MEQALAALAEHKEADILNLRFFVPESLLRLMYRAADAVLANSGFEPFGLVGLEAMAEGGIAFTGATGEDYARSYENAICMETDDPREIAAALQQLRADPALAERIRTEAKHTAKQFTWNEVIEILRRRLESLAYCQTTGAA
jgi:glycosyltransferase involved in cell wall biosynthesis